MSRLALYFDGLEIVEDPDGERSIRPKNPDLLSFGSNETACWRNLGTTPEGHVAKVATGGAASMEARLNNWSTNAPGGIGTGWLTNY